MFYNSVHCSEAIQETRLAQRWQSFTDAQRHMLLLVNVVFLSGLVSLFGIFANLINIVVFYRQGLTTTTNISFFVMAFSDLSCLFFQQWYIVLSFMRTPTLPINNVDFQYITAGVPHEFFARLTCSVTVYVTAERCLCIVFPLKVKRLITIQRTKFIIVCIYIITLVIATPLYFTIYLGWKFSPERNRTLIGLVVKDNLVIAEKTAFTSNAIFGVVSVTAVVIFTSICICKLREKSAWRKLANVQREKSESLSKRDRTTMTMVAVIASVLVVCYTPSVVLCLVSCFEPEFNPGRKHAHPYDVSWSFALLLENINSSVNTFMYFKMSTNYRRTFKALFIGYENPSRSVINSGTVLQHFG